MKQFIYALTILMVIFSGKCIAQLSLVERIDGFNNPVDLTNAGDGSGRLFIVEQAGTIEVLNASYGTLGTFLDISSKVDFTSTELGLLGLTFDPNYENNGYFYVYYSNSEGGLKTKIERYQVSDPAANTANIVAIDTIVTIPQFATNHNGGDLNFGPDGYLYCGTGDGGNSNGPGDSSQLVTNYLGKLLRIDTASLTTEIWALGLRNPWRFSFDRLTGDLWIADVGQYHREEINYIPVEENIAGINYGWNCWEGTIPCPFCGNSSCGPTTFPIYEYSHAIGHSITGGFVTRGAYYNTFAGYYLFADYVDDFIWGINHIDTVVVSSSIANVSSFGEDEYGRIFAVQRWENNGKLFEVIDASAIPVCNSPYQVSNVNDTGVGSLRQMITNASSGSTIYFDLSLFNDSIMLNTPIIINKDLLICANPGQVISIDARNIDNAIQVQPSRTVEIHGLNILGGDGDPGAIWNQGNLRLNHVLIEGNPAQMATESILLNEGILEIEGPVHIKN